MESNQVEIETYTLTPFATNCYVLKSGNEALVIDPGEPSPAVLDSVEGFTVRHVVNTHCHGDHCGGNGAVKEATGASLLCHEAELPMLRSVVEQGALFGVVFTPSPDPDGFLDEGDTITVGEETLEVLFTPGHSPGHIALLGDGYIFGGDVLFQAGVGRTDLPGCDPDALMNTLRHKFLPLPDDTQVYSGHGPATTIGAERNTNPFLVAL
ncbi:MAG: MBL fold metallo-hydrolase [Candidatus Hydrogenedentota bacterium]